MGRVTEAGRKGLLERANGTSRYEFYPFHEGPLTVDAINRKPAEYQTYCNTYRPQGITQGLSPILIGYQAHPSIAAPIAV